MFEALTGAPPFVGRTPLETLMMHKTAAPPSLTEASMGLSFSRSIEAIVQKMLAKDPSDRYRSCSEVSYALTKGFDGLNVQKEKSSSWLYVSGGLVCLAAVTTAAAFFITQRHSSKVSSPKEIVSAAPVSTPKQTVLAAPAEPTEDSFPPDMSVSEVDDGSRDLEVLKPGDLKIDETAGSKKIVLKGEHHRIGSLLWVDAKGSHNEVLSIKPILVPPGSKLWFLADLAVVHNPAILQSFGALKLAGMRFELPKHGKSVVIPIAEGIALIPPTVPGFALDKGDIFAREAAALAARDFRWLSLMECPINDRAADTLAAMPDLESLALARLDDFNSGDASARVTTILAGLTSQKKSCQIRRLNLARTQINLEMCRYIGKMHHLRFLNTIDSLSRKFYLQDALREIGPATQLTELAANAEWLNAQSIKRMQSFKNLKKLYLENPQQWTAEREELMAAQLPHIKVVFVTNPNVGFEPWHEIIELPSSSIRR